MNVGRRRLPDEMWDDGNLRNVLKWYMQQLNPRLDRDVLVYNIDPDVSKTSRRLPDGWGFIDDVPDSERYFKGIRADVSYKTTTLQEICFGEFKTPADNLGGFLKILKRSESSPQMDLFADDGNVFNVLLGF